MAICGLSFVLGWAIEVHETKAAISTLVNIKSLKDVCISFFWKIARNLLKEVVATGFAVYFFQNNFLAATRYIVQLN